MKTIRLTYSIDVQRHFQADILFRGIFGFESLSCSNIEVPTFKACLSRDFRQSTPFNLSLGNGPEFCN